MTSMDPKRAFGSILPFPVSAGGLEHLADSGTQASFLVGTVVAMQNADLDGFVNALKAALIDS